MKKKTKLLDLFSCLTFIFHDAKSFFSFITKQLKLQKSNELLHSSSSMSSLFWSIIPDSLIIESVCTVRNYFQRVVVKDTVMFILNM